jgi:hypothetical protein
MTIKNTPLDELISDIQSSEEVKQSMSIIIKEIANKNNIPYVDFKMENIDSTDFIGIPMFIS